MDAHSSEARQTRVRYSAWQLGFTDFARSRRRRRSSRRRSWRWRRIRSRRRRRRAQRSRTLLPHRAPAVHRRAPRSARRARLVASMCTRAREADLPLRLLTTSRAGTRSARVCRCGRTKSLRRPPQLRLLLRAPLRNLLPLLQRLQRLLLRKTLRLRANQLRHLHQPQLPVTRTRRTRRRRWTR